MASNQVYRPEESPIVHGTSPYTCVPSSMALHHAITDSCVPLGAASESVPVPIGTPVLVTVHAFRLEMHGRRLLGERYIVANEDGRISWHDDPPYNAYQIFELNDALSAAENRPVYLEVVRRPQPTEKPKRILDL